MSRIDRAQGPDGLGFNFSETEAGLPGSLALRKVGRLAGWGAATPPVLVFYTLGLPQIKAGSETDVAGGSTGDILLGARTGAGGCYSSSSWDGPYRADPSYFVWVYDVAFSP